MWAKLSQIAVIAGTAAASLAPEEYARARDAFTTAVRERWGRLPKSAATRCSVWTRCCSTACKLTSRTLADAHWRPPPTRSTGTTSLLARHNSRRYLAQLTVSLCASSVAIVDTTLRQFAGLLVAEHLEVTGFADVRREHIEHFKTWMTARPGYRRSQALSKTTIGMRMGNLRIFFERIIEWNYDDAPSRNPVFAGDRPLKDRPLPRFLNDPSAAKMLTAARALPDPFDRLAVELLSPAPACARTSSSA